jgi:hypothetical protein
MIIQGNIELIVFDEHGNETERRWFYDQTDFDTNCNDASDLDDLEVTYIYPTKAPGGSVWLNIEVMESHEI